MRLVVLAIVALAACAPDIVPGAYLCGPERSCPEDLACNGPDNICVAPGAAEPFACPAGTEQEPNNSAQSAQALPELQCASVEVEVLGCAQDADGEDWYTFEVPASCSTVSVTSSITFPLAYEVMSLEVRDAAGATMVTGGDCGAEDPEDGVDNRCLRTSLTPGGRYTVRVARTGESDCGGACSFNRYSLNLQLTSP